MASAFSITPINYNVSNLTYDGIGNILTMNQYGLKTATSSAVIDSLTYHYNASSNKLMNVADGVNDPNSTMGDFKYVTATKTSATVDYTYDDNGNMVSDQNKKITQITYNILNLPGVIIVAGKGTIKYYYDAAGNKLRKRTSDITASPAKTTTTTYIGGAVYQNDTLQFFGMPEGRVRAKADSSGWVYDYFLKDHLGNTRMMITDDYNVASPILEAYSYYPFGLMQKGINQDLNKTCSCAINMQNFNDNELQNKEFSDGKGLDIYDFNARFYNKQIGRFLQIDPAAEEYQENFSPYHFSKDNPSTFNDPNGRCPWCLIRAAKGLVVDYGPQVVKNRLDGRDWSTSLTQVNGAEIALAMVTGAASGGVSSLYADAVTTGTSLLLTEAQAQGVVSTTYSLSNQVNDNINQGKTPTDISISKIAIDVTSDHIAGHVGEKLIPKTDLKGLENQVDRTGRIAANDPNSSGRAANFENAKSKVYTIRNSDFAKQTLAGNTGSALISNTVKPNNTLSSPFVFSIMPVRDATNVVIPKLEIKPKY